MRDFPAIETDGETDVNQMDCLCGEFFWDVKKHFHIVPTESI